MLGRYHLLPSVTAPIRGVGEEARLECLISRTIFLVFASACVVSTYVFLKVVFVTAGFFLFFSVLECCVGCYVLVSPLPGFRSCRVVRCSSGGFCVGDMGGDVLECNPWGLCRDVGKY
jgi:hypothetical protein